MCSWLCAWSAADFCWMVESREHLWLLFISVWVRSSGDVDEYECNIMQPDGKNRCFQQWINALEHWNGFHTSAGTLIEHEPRAHPEPERLCSFGSSGEQTRCWRLSVQSGFEARVLSDHVLRRPQIWIQVGVGQQPLRVPDDLVEPPNYSAACVIDTNKLRN